MTEGLRILLRNQPLPHPHYVHILWMRRQIFKRVHDLPKVT